MSGNLDLKWQKCFVSLALLVKIFRCSSPLLACSCILKWILFFSIAGAFKKKSAFPLKLPGEKTLWKMFPEIVPGRGVPWNAFRPGLCAESHRSLDHLVSFQQTSTYFPPSPGMADLWPHWPPQLWFRLFSVIKSFACVIYIYSLLYPPSPSMPITHQQEGPHYQTCPAHGFFLLIGSFSFPLLLAGRQFLETNLDVADAVEIKLNWIEASLWLH